MILQNPCKYALTFAGANGEGRTGCDTQAGLFCVDTTAGEREERFNEHIEKLAIMIGEWIGRNGKR